MVCDEVLRTGTPTYEHLVSMDRLNMVCSIPELSMVIAASQKGRAAIFRLTQNPAGYMMRLDEMLPRGEDEPQKRPCAALLGIAVGPIQGREFGRSRSNSAESNARQSFDDDSDECAGEKLSAGVETGTGWRRKKRSMWRGLEKRRRYRLMMVYIDGSILSYELGGTPESEVFSKNAIDGGYLIV